MALPHVAGPFKKTFRDYEQPWHIVKFSGVKDEILKLEPEIFDTPGNEQVCASFPPPVPLIGTHACSCCLGRTSTWRTRPRCCSRPPTTFLASMRWVTLHPCLVARAFIFREHRLELELGACVRANWQQS